MNPNNIKMTILTIVKLILFWKITGQEIVEDIFSDFLLETARTGILKITINSF